MKKRILLLAVALLAISGAANAQYIMKVTDSSNAVLYHGRVDNIDQVTFKALTEIEDYEFAFSDLTSISSTSGATWDSSTGVLYTGQYGISGWSAGYDLSDYSYLVVELSAINTNGWEFRIYPQNTDVYTSDNDIYVADLDGLTADGGTYTLVVDLTNLTTGGGTTINTSNIKWVAFWSYGHDNDYEGETKTITISKVYATNTYPSPSSSGTGEDNGD